MAKRNSEIRFVKVGSRKSASAGERIYTPREIAELLKVAEKTVRNWLAEGRMKGFKVGRLWRVWESEYLYFLELRDKS